MHNTMQLMDSLAILNYEANSIAKLRHNKESWRNQ